MGPQHRLAPPGTRGVSPVVGIIILIGIVVLLGATVGSEILGHDTLQERTPDVQFNVNNTGEQITVTHVDGAPIDTAKLGVILKDGNASVNTQLSQATSHSQIESVTMPETLSAGDAVTIDMAGAHYARQIRLTWNERAIILDDTDPTACAQHYPATIVVAPPGSNTCYDTTSPYTAGNLVDENGIIYVKGGTYTGTRIHIVDKNVSFITKENATLDGGNYPYVATIHTNRTDVLISGFHVTNTSANAVQVGSTSDVTVRNITITDTLRGVHVLRADNVALRDITVYEPRGRGIWLWKVNDSRLEHITVTGQQDQYEADVKMAESHGIEFSHLTLTNGTNIGIWMVNSTEMTGLDLEITGHENNAALIMTGTSQGVSIRSSLLTDNSEGIHIDADASGDEFTIRNSDLAGNTPNRAIYNEGSGTVQAPHNWWGAADGPGGNGPGSGDEIYGGVVYTPWETESYQINQTTR